MTVDLKPEEILAVMEENARLKKTLEAVKEAARWGARMDVHPTRMGGSADTMKEAMWWQNWLIEFDNRWREGLKEALENFDDHEPVSSEIYNRLILEVLEDATLAELMDSPREISLRIIEALRG